MVGLSRGSFGILKGTEEKKALTGDERRRQQPVRPKDRQQSERPRKCAFLRSHRGRTRTDGVISGASERETGPFYGAAAEVGPRS